MMVMTLLLGIAIFLRLPNMPFAEGTPSKTHVDRSSEFQMIESVTGQFTINGATTELTEMKPGDSLKLPDLTGPEMSMALHYQWAVPDSKVHAGDTYTFQLPSNVTFDLNASALRGPLQGNGYDYGNYTIDPNNHQVTFEFNENVEQDDVHGTFHIYKGKLTFESIGNNEIRIPVHDNTDITIPIVVVPGEQAQITKVGTGSDKTNGTFEWLVTANANQDELKQPWLEEKMDDNQVFVGVSIEAEVRNPLTGLATSCEKLTEGTDYTVDTQGNVHFKGKYAFTKAVIVAKYTTRLKHLDQAFTGNVKNGVALHTGDGKTEEPNNPGSNHIEFKPAIPLEKKLVGHNDQTLTWQVLVGDASGIVPAGKQIVDIPDDQQAFPVEGVKKVNVSYGEGQWLAPKDYDVAIANGRLTVALKKNVTSPLKITYTTTLKSSVPEGGLKVKNHVEDNDQPQHELDVDVDIDKTTPEKPGTQWLRKYYKGDYVQKDDAVGKATAGWKVEINYTDQTLVDYTLTDTMSPGLELADKTLVLTNASTGKAVDAADYALTKTANGFTLKFQGALRETSDRFLLDYKTIVTKGGLLTNTITDGTVTSEAHFTPPDKPGTDVNSKTGSYDDVAQVFSWDIWVNQSHQKLTNAIVTDPIRVDQKLVPDSVQVYAMDDEGEHLVTDDSVHVDLPTGPFGPQPGINYDQWAQSNKEPPAAKAGRTLTVHLPEKTTAAYRIHLETKPISLADTLFHFKDYGLTDIQHAFGNIAYLNDTEITGPYFGGTMKWPSKLISKGGVLGSVNGTVEWHLDVNEMQDHLENVVVTDHLNAGQRLVGGFRIQRLYEYKKWTNTTNTTDWQFAKTDADKGTFFEKEEPDLVLGKDYDVTTQIASNGEITSTIRFLHGLTRAYRVTYTSQFEGTQPAVNSASLTADNVKGEDTTGNIEVTPGGSGATGTGTTGFIKIVKTDGVTKQPLAGAQFKLLDADRQTLRRGVDPTNAEGEIEWENLVSGTYYLQEVAAPTGYALDPQLREIKLQGLKQTMSEEERTLTVALTNEPLIDLQINKQSVNQRPLAGAQFQLYKDAAFTKPYGDGKIYTTGKNGRVLIKDLPAGTYYLKEVAAPRGYLVTTDIPAVEARPNKAGTPTKVTVTDRPLEILPHTGGHGRMPLVWAALAVVTLGLMAFLYRFRNGGKAR